MSWMFYMETASLKQPVLTSCTSAATEKNLAVVELKLECFF